MFNVDSKVISKFNGIINGVEFDNQEFYYSTEWFLLSPLQELDFKESIKDHLEELTRLIKEAFERTYSKSANYNLAELEWDLEILVRDIKWRQDTIRTYDSLDLRDTPYFDRVFDYIIEHLV